MANTILNIEHNLISVLTKMELVGVEIDLRKLLKVEHELNQVSEAKAKLIQSFTAKQININSTQQLSEFLFFELKLEPP